MSIEAFSEGTESGQLDHEQIVHEWFLDLLRDRPEKQVADILGVSSSKLWKLKKGQQRLRATELIILHQRLDAPLPDLVSGGRKSTCTASSPKRTDTKSLFDFAYDRVCDLERRKPEAQRVDEFERLEQVFHILKTIQETPEALELKDR